MPEIVTVGEALVEIMRTERDRPLDRPALFSGPYPSGAPAILASAAARLGASVGFVGTVGDDAFGDCVESRLRADGIDCSALCRNRERLTGIAFVAYRSDGSRSFLFHLRDSAAAWVSAEQIPAGYLDDARHVHIMGSSLAFGDALRETCYFLAREVYRRGGTVSLDPNLRPELMPVERIRAICQPIVEMATLVLPSGEELTALTGAPTLEEGVARLLAQGVQLVALKQGAHGSTLFSGQGALSIPPFRVEEVDPTGAGDCYDAALIVAWQEGHDWATAGTLANAVGALATTRWGPMEGTFCREEVLAFMAQQGRPWPGASP
ncbi:MAG: sugar kinase [Chloroflexi bacterium]|nr:sugar kinase [Chloroflexota bacterium]